MKNKRPVMNDTLKEQMLTYYMSSRAWYYERYLRPQFEILFFLVVGITLLCGLYVMHDIISFFDQKTTMRFPIYVENDSDEQHYIKNLSTVNQSIDEVFARYMLRRYVGLRETYYPDLLIKENWESALMNLSSMSSHEVFDSFLKKLLPSQNPDSPLVRFRFGNTITPYIKDIQMTDYSVNKPIAAIVYFDSMKCNESYENCLSKSFVAEIRFEMVHKIDYFRFKVADYKSYPLPSSHLQ